MSNGFVQPSADLARVAALPRRVWTREAALALAVWLTAQLCTAAGRAAGVMLFPQQAIFLWELYQNRGAYGALPPGSGKTLVSWLAAYMLRSMRPHVFTLANLRDNKTPKDFARYQKHWATPSPPPQVEGYSLLSPDENLHLLEDRRPDLLFLDECDKLRNAKNTASKRIGGYVDMVRGDCVVVGTTGTPQRHSIKDDAHIVTWALRERSPVPLSSDAMNEWANCVDASKAIQGERLRPGPLLIFADESGIPQTEGELYRVREGLARRFEETPGVIVWPEDSCDQSITIRFFVAPDDPIIEQTFIAYRETSCAPDGWPLNDAIVKWGKEREFGSGFYYIYDPRPPQEWINAKYADACFCRDMITATESYNRARDARGPKPLDTEEAVRRAFPDEECIETWKRIKKTFKPNSVPVWLSGSVLHWAASWARQRHGRAAGIVWCEHDAMATALGQLTGLPMFGENGLRITPTGQVTDEDVDTYVERFEADAQPTIICKSGANERGRNLQMYNDNLVIGMHPSAEKAEQLLARTHRMMQLRSVNVDVLITCGSSLKAFHQALAEARQVERMKRLPQKILSAVIDYGETSTLPLAARWVQSKVQ